MASHIYVAWIVGLLLLLLVYLTQGSCVCGIQGAFKATCPGLDKSSCDKSLVAKNLNQCRRRCAGKRSGMDILLQTGDNAGPQYRPQKMTRLPEKDSINGWAEAVADNNDWTSRNTANSQCLLDSIVPTLPQMWQDYIFEAIESAVSDNSELKRKILSFLSSTDRQRQPNGI